MNNTGKISNVVVIRDNKEKKFIKAWITVNGEKIKLDNHEEITEYLNDLKEQENVESLKDLPQSMFKNKFLYDTAKAKEGEYVQKLDLEEYEKQQDKEYFSSIFSLRKKSPHEGKKTSGIKKVAITAAVVALALGIAHKAGALDTFKSGFTNTQKEHNLENDENEKNNSLATKKESPKTWEEYLNYEGVQKDFAKKVMDTLITPNIITKEINGENITYGLTPQQAMAFSLYYNSNYMSNEDMLAILGDYSLTGNSDQSKDLVNQANSALDTIRLSWAAASIKEEMIRPVVEDEKVQVLIDKYMDLIMDYKNAENTKDKKAAKKVIEESLNNDFIDAKDGVINLYDHPSAHVVLNSIPSVMSLLLDPLDEDLNKIIVGTEGNYDIVTDGGTINKQQVKTNKITIPQTGGLVDSPCAVYIARFNDFDNYYQEKTSAKVTQDMNNEFLNNQVSVLEQQIKTLEATKTMFNKKTVESQITILETQLESYKASITVSDYDRITAQTYEYDNHDEHQGVIIPIMTDYVNVKGFTDLETFAEEFHELIITSIQEKQLNNTGKFSRENPSGGKVGDTYSETKKNVTVSESQISETQKNEAQKEANEKAGADIVTREEGEKEAADVQSEVNKILAVKNELLNYYMEKGPSAAEYNSSWANSEHEAVRNQYNVIKNEGIRVHKEIQNNKNTVTDEGKDNTPSHDQNPNQKDSSSTKTETNTNDNSAKETTTSTPDSSTSENKPVTPVETPKEEGKVNTNNAGSSTGSSEYEINTDGVIEGTITTDDSNVFDPSQFGTYEVTTSEVNLLNNAAPVVEVSADSTTTTVENSISEESVQENVIDLTALYEKAAEAYVEEMAANPTPEEEMENTLVK